MKLFLLVCTIVSSLVMMNQGLVVGINSLLIGLGVITIVTYSRTDSLRLVYLRLEILVVLMASGGLIGCLMRGNFFVGIILAGVLVIACGLAMHSYRNLDNPVPEV